MDEENKKLEKIIELFERYNATVQGEHLTGLKFRILRG